MLLRFPSYRSLMAASVTNKLLVVRLDVGCLVHVFLNQDLPQVHVVAGPGSIYAQPLLS